jgi:hypothetical protein
MSGAAPPVDEDEILYRQVHPTFVRDGRPSSQAFRPTPKDQGKLSVARGSLTTASAAYEHHTVSLGLRSGGTWGLMVAECAAQALPVLPDPLTSPPEKVPDPAHAVVDFSGLSNSKVEAKGMLLARGAASRGRLHPPVDPGEPLDVE